MKNTFKILGIIALVAVIGTTMIACGSGGSSPSTVVKKFLDAGVKGDAKEMEKYATKETIALLAMFGSKSEEMYKNYSQGKILSENIDGDKATVKMVGSDGEESDIDLIKVDGKWVINASMDK